jgi:hypothetical protein
LRDRAAAAITIRFINQMPDSDDSIKPLSPDKNVEHKPNYEAGNEGADASTQKHRKQEETPADDKSFTRPLIDVLLGLGVLGFLPDILDDLGLHIITIWAWWLSLCLGALAVVHFTLSLWPKQARGIWVAFKAFVPLTIIGFGFWTFVLLHPKVTRKPTFSITAYQQEVELNKPRRFLLWNVNGRNVLSPVHVNVLADLTNLKDTPLTIKSFDFEGRTTNGNWETMPLIDPRFGHLIWTTRADGDLRQPVFRQEYGTNVFPAVLVSRKIARGDTITGEIFLEAPKHGFTGDIRLRIRDATDVEDVQLMRPPVPITNFLSNIPTVSGFQGFREPEDVSKLPIRRYSDEMPPPNK